MDKIQKKLKQIKLLRLEMKKKELQIDLTEREIIKLSDIKRGSIVKIVRNAYEGADEETKKTGDAYIGKIGKVYEMGVNHDAVYFKLEIDGEERIWQTFYREELKLVK